MKLTISRDDLEGGFCKMHFMGSVRSFYPTCVRAPAPQHALSSAVPAPERALTHAGNRGCKISAGESAEFSRTSRSSQDDHKNLRKNVVGITLAPFAAGSKTDFRALRRCRRRRHCSWRFAFPESVPRYFCCAFQRYHFFASWRHLALQYRCIG